MDTPLVALVILLLSVTFYAVHLVRVVRDDDRGHAFTHREPPRSHLGDSSWPPRSL